MQSKMKRNRQEEGWESNAPSDDESLTEEERSLDIGESGQFAPGGYYNQQEFNRAKHGSLDDDDIMPLKHR